MSKWFIPLAVGAALVGVVLWSAVLEYQRERASTRVEVANEQ